jgi:hypothetical protein
VATNTAHAGILLVPSSLPGNEYDVIAEAIVEESKPYAKGLVGIVLYVRHAQSNTQ